MRLLFTAWCGPLLLAGCARTVAKGPASAPGSSDLAEIVTTRPADYPGTSEFVEAMRDYGNPRDVPAPFQYLVNWHAGTGPVVLLFTAGARRACALTPLEAGRVLVRQYYTCRWSAAR